MSISGLGVAATLATTRTNKLQLMETATFFQ
jgi:hypothetical protein